MPKIDVEVKREAKTPTVTIGIPVYNGENYLREALDSALAQTLYDFEIVISDNASTDGTPEICKEYAAKDPRIRYFRQPINIGAMRNFKFVAFRGRGKYFTWLAHDDLLKPEYLEVMVNYLRQHPEVVLVASDFYKVDFKGRIIEECSLDQIRGHIKWRKRIRRFFSVRGHKYNLPIYGVMCLGVCKKVLNDLPKNSESWAGEWFILAGIAAQGHIDSLPLFLRSYRVHPNSEGNELSVCVGNKSLLAGIAFNFITDTKLFVHRIKCLASADVSDMSLFGVLIMSAYTYVYSVSRWSIGFARKKLNQSILS